VAREAASRSALQRIIRTFFDGSAKDAVAALLDPAAFHLTEEELSELARIVDRAKKERR
jgi:predicted transcriptional regulator